MTNNNISRYGGTTEGAFVRQRTYAANEQRATHAVSKSGMDNYHMLEEVIKPAELATTQDRCNVSGESTRRV